MALPASGQITLNQVNVELGNSGTAQIDMNSAAVRGLFGIASGEIEMSDGYGKANTFAFTISSNTQEANLSTLATAAGWNGSSFIEVTINSGLYIWSDSLSVAGLLINTPCKVFNSGKIMGMGGHGGGSRGTAPAGGPAIKINSGVNGVIIQNNSGAYIAGGGGGGFGTASGSSGYGTGGGGAGGGEGGKTFGSAAYGGNPSTQYSNRAGEGDGGAIGQAGADGGSAANGGTAGTGYDGSGGGAGGGGAYFAALSLCAGAGGRILPGTGGAFGGSVHTGNNPRGGNGGGAGNAGSNGVSNGAGGGGGWGAQGGAGGAGQAGAAGGSAIDDSGQSYTLSNSGTIYGAT